MIRPQNHTNLILLKLLEALCLLCSLIIFFFPTFLYMAMFIDIFDLKLFRSDPNSWQILVISIFSMISYGVQVIRIFQIVRNRTPKAMTIGMGIALLFYLMMCIYSLFEYYPNINSMELLVYTVPVFATSISFSIIYAQSKRQAS